MKETTMKEQSAVSNAAKQTAEQQSTEPTREELRDQIRQAEQDFRDLQERYDLFVMRYYAHRYEPWFEDASDLYRRGIRRRFFRLLKLERQEQELLANLTNGRVISSDASRKDAPASASASPAAPERA